MRSASLKTVYAVFYAAVYGAVLLSLVGSVCADAQDGASELDARAYQMYQQVLSPFCPGRSLNDCPSSKAHELKSEMRQKLEQGVAPEVIIEGVFAKFGDQYRAVPSYSGFGRLIWWMPIGFFVLGVAVIVVLARGKRRSTSGVPGARGAEKSAGGEATGHDKTLSKETLSNETLSDEMRRAIERELESLDG